MSNTFKRRNKPAFRSGKKHAARDPLIAPPPGGRRRRLILERDNEKVRPAWEKA
jgi:hypothetical protein